MLHIKVWNPGYIIWESIGLKMKISPYWNKRHIFPAWEKSGDRFPTAMAVKKIKIKKWYLISLHSSQVCFTVGQPIWSESGERMFCCPHAHIFFWGNQRHGGGLLDLLTQTQVLLQPVASCGDGSDPAGCCSTGCRDSRGAGCKMVALFQMQWVDGTWLMMNGLSSLTLDLVQLVTYSKKK